MTNERDNKLVKYYHGRILEQLEAHKELIKDCEEIEKGVMSCVDIDKLREWVDLSLQMEYLEYCTEIRGKLSEAGLSIEGIQNEVTERYEKSVMLAQISTGNSEEDIFGELGLEFEEEAVDDGEKLEVEREGGKELQEVDTEEHGVPKVTEEDTEEFEEGDNENDKIIIYDMGEGILGNPDGNEVEQHDEETAEKPTENNALDSLCDSVEYDSYEEEDENDDYYDSDDEEEYDDEIEENEDEEEYDNEYEEDAEEDEEEDEEENELWTADDFENLDNDYPVLDDDDIVSDDSYDEYGEDEEEDLFDEEDSDEYTDEYDEYSLDDSDELFDEEDSEEESSDAYDEYDESDDDELFEEDMEEDDLEPDYDSEYNGGEDELFDEEDISDLEAEHDSFESSYDEYGSDLFSEDNDVYGSFSFDSESVESSHYTNERGYDLGEWNSPKRSRFSDDNSNVNTGYNRDRKIGDSSKSRPRAVNRREMFDNGTAQGRKVQETYNGLEAVASKIDNLLSRKRR